MIEVTLAFLAGYLLNWYALIILLIIGSTFESHGSHGWAVFVGLVAMTSAYFFFNIATSSLLLYGIAYLVAGFVWSFWRYKRHADKVVDSCKAMSDSYKKREMELLAPNKMLDKITTWVVIWPFSMLENVLGDVFSLVQTAISKFFKGVYNRIYASAVAQVTYDNEQ